MQKGLPKENPKVPLKLTTTISKIPYVPNFTNSELIKDFYQYMVENDSSERNQKKTKRLSPYAEAELWERDDILSIIKYEPYKRNKAALALFWDLDARNHEVTLKIRHIRLKDRYVEGEIPYNTKTGGGPILLTCSFPYVRDWLNEHLFKNEPDAKIDMQYPHGAAINPEAMWTMMKQLRKRIIHLLEDGSIANEDERDHYSCCYCSESNFPSTLSFFAK
jgi:hypothetical protein